MNFLRSLIICCSQKPKLEAVLQVFPALAWTGLYLRNELYLAPTQASRPGAGGPGEALGETIYDISSDAKASKTSKRKKAPPMKLVHQMKMGSEGVSVKEEGSVEGKGEASRATEPGASSQGGEVSVLLLVQRRDQGSSQEVVSGNSIFGIFENRIPRKNTPTKRLVSQSLMKSEEVSEKEGRYVNTMAEDTRDEETMSKGKAAETLYEREETVFVDVSDAVGELDSSWAKELKLKVEVKEAMEEIKDTRRKKSKAARVWQEPQSAFSQFCQVERARVEGRVGKGSWVEGRVVEVVEAGQLVSLWRELTEEEREQYRGRGALAALQDQQVQQGVVRLNVPGWRPRIFPENMLNY